MTTAVERGRRVDTLVNNAGVFVAKPFTTYTAEDYAFVTAVNLTGFFYITQRAIAQMLAQGDGGHVVNMTTTLVEHADVNVPSALASLTKGGLAAVTKSLANEYAHKGIRVNAVSPGVIDTPMHADDDLGALAGLHPLGRIGSVADIVAGVLTWRTRPSSPANSCISTVGKARGVETHRVRESRTLVTTGSWKAWALGLHLIATKAAGTALHRVDRLTIQIRVLHGGQGPLLPRRLLVTRYGNAGTATSHLINTRTRSFGIGHNLAGYPVSRV